MQQLIEPIPHLTLRCGVANLGRQITQMADNAESYASRASYRGTEADVEALLEVARRLRDVAAETAAICAR